MRIKWGDGFRDILRFGNDGKMSFYALDKVGAAEEETDWASTPRFRLQGVRLK